MIGSLFVYCHAHTRGCGWHNTHSCWWFHTVPVPLICKWWFCIKKCSNVPSKARNKENCSQVYMDASSTGFRMIKNEFLWGGKFSQFKHIRPPEFTQCSLVNNTECTVSRNTVYIKPHNAPLRHLLWITTLLLPFLQSAVLAHKICNQMIKPGTQAAVFIMKRITLIL